MGLVSLSLIPTAYAVGCILPPLRGWIHSFRLRSYSFRFYDETVLVIAVILEMQRSLCFLCGFAIFAVKSFFFLHD